MITIDTTELKQFAAHVPPEMQRQIPFAISRTLNDLMFVVMTDLRELMERSFDRPTPYIVRSLKYRKSDKQNLRFLIYPEEFGKGGLTPQQVLEPEVAGGSRPMKRSEARIGSYWVPGSGARLDRYGNVPGQELTLILSRLGASSDPMQNQTVRSRGRAAGRGALRVFFRQGNIIYERKGKEIMPYLILTGAPHYSPRLSWQERAKEIVDEKFMPEFRVRFQEALDTAINRAVSKKVVRE
jgi:hypothetical protein